MRVTLLAFVAVAVLQSLTPSGAVADGCYIPAVAHPAPPSIPKQRALIVHRNGVERLIVESSLDAEGQSFGWIIPVPAPPTDLAKVTPGVLDTLGYVTEPEITHDLRSEFHIAIFVAVLALLIFVATVWRSWAPFLLAGLLVLAAYLLLPMLGTRAGSSSYSIGIEVREVAQVGSYDVAVLGAANADALDQWLKQSGFVMLPGSGPSIVEDYVRDKWSFVVARLRKEGAGLCAPHPLSITFPAATAVYPMRLTALSASPVALELYCIADYQASVDGLGLDFCDVLEGPQFRQVSVNYASCLYRPRSYERTVGLPTLVGLVWNGCALTRLSAGLRPDSMTRDYQVNQLAPKASRRHWYSTRGALMTGAIASLLAWSLLLILGGALTQTPCDAQKASSLAIRRVVVPVTLFALLMLGVVYLILPKVPVVIEDEGKLLGSAHEMAYRVEEFVKSDPGLAGMTIEAIRERCRSHLRDEVRQANNLTGSLIREQEAPGDYQILEDERGVVFRGFTEGGFPLDMVLRPASPDRKPVLTPGS